MPTADENHAGEMRNALIYRRNAREQERLQLLKATERIAQIDAELVLINADLRRYGYEDPKPVEPNPI